MLDQLLAIRAQIDTLIRNITTGDMDLAFLSQLQPGLWKASDLLKHAPEGMSPRRLGLLLQANGYQRVRKTDANYYKITAAP